MSIDQSPRSTPAEARTSNLSAWVLAQFQSGYLPWPEEETEIPSCPDIDTGEVESYMVDSAWRKQTDAGETMKVTTECGLDADEAIAWRIMRDKRRWL